MKKAEELSLQTGIEVKEGEELIKVTQVENTPFHIVSSEQGHFVAIGNARLTEFQNSFEDAENLVNSKDWSLLLNTVIFLTTKPIKNEQHS